MCVTGAVKQVHFKNAKREKVEEQMKQRCGSVQMYNK